MNYLYDASGNRVGKRSFERANVQNAYPYYPQQEEFYLRDATGNIFYSPHRFLLANEGLCCTKPRAVLPNTYF